MNEPPRITRDAPAAVGGHVRIYRKSEISDRLSSAGFALYGSHRAHALHSPYWWLKCAIGVNKTDNMLVRKYHDLLVWDLMKKPPATHRLTAPTGAAAQAPMDAAFAEGGSPLLANGATFGLPADLTRADLLTLRIDDLPFA